MLEGTKEVDCLPDTSTAKQINKQAGFNWAVKQAQARNPN